MSVCTTALTQLENHTASAAADGAHLTFISLQGVLCPAQSSCLPDFPGVPSPLRLEVSSIQCPALCCWFYYGNRRLQSTWFLFRELGHPCFTVSHPPVYKVPLLPSSLSFLLLSVHFLLFCVCLYVCMLCVCMCVQMSVGDTCTDVHTHICRDQRMISVAFLHH